MHNSDRLGFAMFFMAIVLLAFIGGAYIVLAKVFPYDYLNNAYQAGKALLVQRSIDDPYTETDLWRRARTDERGVTINDSEQAYQGYTLYTSGDGTYAQLVDMKGDVAHRWELPFSEVWQETPSGKTPRPDDLMYWRKARMLPNGDLVAIYIAANDSPWGYGMVKVDRDSKLLWSYKAHVHHDLDIAEDGRIATLTHDFTDEKIEKFPQLPSPWLNDYLVELDGESGDELSKTSLLHAFFDSSYAGILYATPHFGVADPMHTNSVEYLEQAQADAFAPAEGKAGQVILSFRHPGAIALVDPESSRMNWAIRGPWMGQHYARVLENGNFTLFDNLANYEKGNRSRVLEVNPQSNAIVRYYIGDDEHPFDSGLRGAAETLPNGNRLITESDGGRLFEVTPAGDIVWEFINPVRGGDKDQFIPVVSSAQRIAPEQLGADFRAVIDTTRRTSS
ncbi:arylsulfotransferase family protein [Halomonas sp. PR-M31]|uniref:arylsulfotransferase family protein n=1 Tax=Halomonas sp. PR-M31 TaxID=1471202 RepID=UPI000651D74B|nr:arylsulfotransferase family protein [Halomonas sp. PR-M31]